MFICLRERYRRLNVSNNTLTLRVAGGYVVFYMVSLAREDLPQPRDHCGEYKKVSTVHIHPPCTTVVWLAHRRPAGA